MTTSLIEDSWAQYESKILAAIDPKLDAGTRALMKHAFYFGAFGITTVLTTVVEHAEDPEAIAAGLAVLQQAALAFLEEHTAELH